MLVLAVLAAVAGAEYAALDSGLPWPGAVSFLRQGVIRLPGLLEDEWRAPAFRPALARAQRRAQLAFNRFALRWLNCSHLLPPERHDDLDASEAAIIECDSQGSMKRPPYYQLLNLHESEPFFHEIATRLQMGALAADLLQKPAVRLYQTGMFRKDPKSKLPKTIANEPTSYHRDLNQIPVDTNHFVTFWCPLHDIQKGDSVLSYALESHLDITHFYWYGGERDRTRVRHTIVKYPKLRLGDCVAHHGQLLHAAPKQLNNRVREAITFSYVDAMARKLPADKQRPHGLPIFDMNGKTEDMLSFQRWWPDIKHGAILDHPSLPIVWPPPAEKIAAEPGLQDLTGVINTEDAYVEVQPDESWHGPDEETLLSNTLSELFDEL